MSEIASVFEELESVSGSNAKLDIMKSLKGDVEDLFKTICFLTYDPSIDFYVKKFNRYYSEPEISLDTALALLKEHVASRTYTGNEAIQYVEQLHSIVNHKEAEIFWRVVQRDLRLGISAKTINKVWPNLIYIHPYMRCSSFSEKNLKNISFPCFSQTKMDGMYADIICEDKTVKVMSRNGQESKIQLVEETKQELVRLFDGFVIQGEMLALDEEGQFMDRSLSNGYLNSDSIDPARVQFVAWDLIDVQDFYNHSTKTTYNVRYKTLEQVISESNYPFVRLVNTKICYNADEVMEHFKEKREQGEEGTVIKDMKTFWKDGTSKQQIKVKVIFDCDLEVVDLKEGTGKNVGRLGSIQCKSVDGLMTVSVGTGLSDEQRAQFWENKEQLIGKILTAQANDVIKGVDENSNWTLFLPRFVELREDKTEADSLDRIQEQVKSFTDALQLLKS
jgi:hypothetical protein